MVEEELCPLSLHNPLAWIALVVKVSFLLEIKKIATSKGARSSPSKFPWLTFRAAALPETIPASTAHRDIPAPIRA